MASADISRRGLMLILSSPSGAGKTTLTRTLIEQKELELQLSISVTTRARRPSEVGDVHYHFIEKDQFIFRRDRGDLLEWAEVHGNFYGTPRQPVEKALSEGHDMVFDIDWQGTQQIVEKMRDDVVTVFILPPSFAELRSRLDRRAEDAADVIAKRLENARTEIARWEAYDYVLINDDLNQAFKQLVAILTAERLKRQRRIGLPAYVEGLLGEN
ncbi:MULTISPECIES: guanylate kinase [unclassified Chelatococcus]|uniref:guanylate kinase n=1 Tax=unclassified Chelatococcus TaxID=2638111 RepID=UPI001BCE9F30|nr:MULTISPECIES: guanylate kinase [unclassified Chelatococcus]CAH1670446.1 guanylate kinase [Hyphomicrobiales bacterium]MBS7738338.1 guanylate kinase [Chelatococcus sp. HY11]MBX3545866.1 guanylate kinase [Chelatococcus sp.]MCO5077316.1 guanylate kinase [Chelatococcus sp.]CAH1677323.1 guanylate kinase [Hyphomicrobiales bacterium]